MSIFDPAIFDGEVSKLFDVGAVAPPITLPIPPVQGERPRRRRIEWGFELSDDEASLLVVLIRSLRRQRSK